MPGALWVGGVDAYGGGPVTLRGSGVWVGAVALWLWVWSGDAQLGVGVEEPHYEVAGCFGFLGCGVGAGQLPGVAGGVCCGDIPSPVVEGVGADLHTYRGRVPGGGGGVRGWCRHGRGLGSVWYGSDRPPLACVALGGG